MNSFLLMVILTLVAQGGWSEPARVGSLPAFTAEMAGVQVVFLDGAVVVEKRSGYRVTTNSAELVPVKGQKDTYGSIGRVGGVKKILPVVNQ